MAGWFELVVIDGICSCIVPSCPIWWLPTIAVFIELIPSWCIICWLCGCCWLKSKSNCRVSGILCMFSKKCWKSSWDGTDKVGSWVFHRPDVSMIALDMKVPLPLPMYIALVIKQVVAKQWGVVEGYWRMCAVRDLLQVNQTRVRIVSARLLHKWGLLRSGTGVSCRSSLKWTWGLTANKWIGRWRSPYAQSLDARSFFGD